MSSIRRQQKHRCASEWRTLIAEWESSNEPARTFCERHGFSTTSLYGWRKRLQRTPGDHGAFLPVQVRQPQSTESRDSSDDGWVEIISSTGRALRVHGNVEMDALAQVLKAVEQC